MGKVRVRDAGRGRIADVSALGNYAYLGGFAPCGRGGVYVIDISSPAKAREVGFIPTRNGSFVGEGVQALTIRTESFKGDILVINNEICSARSGQQIGGFSIFDVSNPRKPVALVEGAGDAEPRGRRSAVHQIHSAFAWQPGGKAYVVSVDDEERGADVDIFDVTDPRQPRQIAETGLRDWRRARNAQAIGPGRASFFHDVVVRRVRGDWLMLASYWDAGYVILNVDDPARPRFVADTDFTYPDPEAVGRIRAEGNAHEAEWSRDGRFILAADEDFGATRIRSFRSGLWSGSRAAVEAIFTPSIASLPGRTLSGRVVHVGRGCPPRTPGDVVPVRGDRYLADPRGKIALIERGACRFDDKIARAQKQGATGVIVYNTAPAEIVRLGGNNPVRRAPEGSPALVGTTIRIPAISVNRRTGLALAEARSRASVRAIAEFNGWGYLHLFDARTLREIDTYAIPEARSPAFLRTPSNPAGFGTLSVHEVTTDFERNLAYVAYYDGGFRVLRFNRRGFEEVAHYTDARGNDFWGIEAHRLPGSKTTYALASDRDRGLWIFRYTGP